MSGDLRGVEIGDRICELSARVHTIIAELVGLAAEFDQFGFGGAGGSNRHEVLGCSAEASGAGSGNVITRAVHKSKAGRNCLILRQFSRRSGVKFRQN